MSDIDPDELVKTVEKWVNATPEQRDLAEVPGIDLGKLFEPPPPPPDITELSWLGLAMLVLATLVVLALGSLLLVNLVRLVARAFGYGP